MWRGTVRIASDQAWGVLHCRKRSTNVETIGKSANGPPASPSGADPIGVTEERRERRALLWCLASTMLSTVFLTWCVGGTVFVLFLNALGLSKGQMGLVSSIVPFCGLIAPAVAPLATRWGRKRVFLLCFGLRKLVMGALVLLPWIVSRSGPGAGLLFLSVVIGLFALLRALAETAYTPWEQEFVPNRVRGRFGAWNALVAYMASGVALWSAARIIGTGGDLSRYQLLIGGGAVIGIISVLVMVKIPGGAPMDERTDASTHLSDLREALRDGNFRTFLLGRACEVMGAGMAGAFFPLFLTERLGMPSSTVIALGTAGVLGGAVTSLGWGWLADKVGSRPVLLPTMGFVALSPMVWLLAAHVRWSTTWCAGLLFACGAAGVGMGVGAGRLCLNSVVPPQKSTAYTSILYACLGLMGGIAALVAGGIMAVSKQVETSVHGIAVDGYTVLFSGSTLVLGVGWALYGRVRRDGAHTTRTVLRGLWERAVVQR